MRNRIIQTAREKINRYGWRKFTIEDIASELGVSKNTVYKYFTSKNEIISALVDWFIEIEKVGALKVLETDGKWTDKIQTLMGSFSPDKPIWVIEELERFFPQEWVKIKALYELREAQISELYLEARENGEVRPDIVPAIIFLTASSTLEGLHDHRYIVRYLEKANLTINNSLEEFKKILFEGILSKNYRDRLNQDLFKYPPAHQKLVFNAENNHTKNKIIQVAMEKINQSGWRKLTIDGITAELGISKKTVYENFKGKNEIISAVVDTYIEMEKTGALKAFESEGSLVDKMQAVFLGFAPDMPVRITEELQRFFPQEWVKIEDMRKFRRAMTYELGKKALENGEIRSDIAPDIIGITMLCTVDALHYYDNLRKMDITFNKALVEFIKILYTGILTKKGQDKHS